VPENANTSVETAEMPSVNVGLLKSLKSDLKTPSCGASAGRSCTPTAIVTVKTIVGQLPSVTGMNKILLAVIIHINPSQQSQDILPRV
jgi:hypothetical protein